MATQIPAQSRLRVMNRDLHSCVRCRTPIEYRGQWHHRRSRSIRDEHQHCTCNGIYLCATCHAWVHANPFEARAHGWIVSRYALPNDEQVFHQGGWVMLDCEGTYTVV